MRKKLFSVMILPFGLLMFLSSCKKDENEEMQSTINIAQCQSQYDAIMTEFNASIAEVNQIWLDNQNLQCSWYFLAYNNQVVIANQAASQLNGQCVGWQILPFATLCPPH